MSTFRIESRSSGLVAGYYDGASARDAFDAMVRDALASGATDCEGRPTAGEPADWIIVRVPTFEPTEPFIVPPECQGQGVEYAYALDAYACVIIERRTDRSEPIGSRVTFQAFEYPAGDPGEWEPQNGRPVLGEPIGRCAIRGPD